MFKISLVGGWNTFFLGHRKALCFILNYVDGLYRQMQDIYHESVCCILHKVICWHKPNKGLLSIVDTKHGWESRTLVPGGRCVMVHRPHHSWLHVHLANSQWPSSSLLRPLRWTSASYLCIPLACIYSCFKPMLSHHALCSIVLCCFAVGSHGWNARATNDGQNEDVLLRICNIDCPTYCLIS